MNTVIELLELAVSQIGVHEDPPNSNSVLYNDWYYGRHVEGKEYPWCMVFLQWCYSQVGVKLPIRTASCTAMMEAARKVNRWRTSNYQRGDLLIYSFNANRTPSHCGVLYEWRDKNHVYAVEGNTSVKNDTNGGAVMMRDRPLRNVLGAFRPKFEDEEDVMDISKLTDEECYNIFVKAMRHAGTLPEPEWSEKLGYWKRAAEDKLVDGTRPEACVKRDELIKILGEIRLL